MAKELHIKIDKQIGGLFIDEDGWLSVGYSSNELDYALSEMPNPSKLIIHASSPGGDIEQGFKIYNRLLDLRKSGTEIHVINEAKAYSIMTFIAMAASPGKLFARKASMWSVHKPMIDPGWGLYNADELRKYANELDSFEAVIVDAYQSRTGKDKAALEAMLREDIIINSTEALEQGWIDEILDNEANTEEKMQSAKMVALKPVAFLSKHTTELPQNLNNKETIMADETKALSLVDRVLAAAKELVSFKAQTGETETTETVEETTETVANETETTTDPDPKDAEIERLKAELAAERAEKEQTVNALTEAEKAMALVKTSFVPQARQNSFEKAGTEKPGEEVDLKERMRARKEATNKK